MSVDSQQSSLIIVDLGELSTTEFGSQVIAASIGESEGTHTLYIDTGVIQKEFRLTKDDPPGTVVVFDGNGEAIGVTREVYSCE